MSSNAMSNVIKVLVERNSLDAIDLLVSGETADAVIIEIVKNLANYNHEINEEYNELLNRMAEANNKVYELVVRIGEMQPMFERYISVLSFGLAQGDAKTYELLLGGQMWGIWLTYIETGNSHLIRQNLEAWGITGVNADKIMKNVYDKFVTRQESPFVDEPAPEVVEKPASRRGRKPGTKNKPKTETQE